MADKLMVNKDALKWFHECILAYLETPCDNGSKKEQADAIIGALDFALTIDGGYD